jgi:hypothetical protein
MKNVIIFTDNDGNLAICVPTGELPIEEVQVKDIPAGVQSYIVPMDSLPQSDFDFRNAWQQVNGNVTVNINKAREITKTRLRIARQPLLEAQDVAFQRALESNLDTSGIVTEKQRLRNITLLVNNAQSLEDLRQIQV